MNKFAFDRQWNGQFLPIAGFKLKRLALSVLGESVLPLRSPLESGCPSLGGPDAYLDFDGAIRLQLAVDEQRLTAVCFDPK